MIQPGQAAPDFELVDLDGASHRRAAVDDRLLVLNFWSASCPHSARTDELIRQLQPGWADRVAVWWIASNANETAAELQRAAAERGVGPVLLDSDQAVADAYGAVATPHLFVMDLEGLVRYEGAPDNVSLRVRQPSVNYLQQAVAALLAGRQPDPAQTQAFGCALVRSPLSSR